jgi:hypothetical protein
MQTLGNVTFETNGANLTITASLTGAPIDLGNANTFQANGGDVVILASGLVSGDAGSTFYARAVGTTSNKSSGGALEIGSGTTKSLIKNALKLPANTNPPAGTLGFGVTPTNVNGVIVKNSTGSIDLNPGPGPASTVTLNRGFMVFDAMSPGSSVIIDDSTFKTEALKPIAFSSAVVPGNEPVLPEGLDSMAPSDESVRILAEPGALVGHSHTGAQTLRTGAIFVEARQTCTIETELGTVHTKKGALVSVERTQGALYVRACSRSGDVAVITGGRRIQLHPGCELIVTNHRPSDADLKPSDGIGRRDMRTEKLHGELHATVCDFSIVTVISNSIPLSSLKLSAQSADRKLLERLVRTAAAVDMVTKVRGPYSGRGKEVQDDHGWSHYPAALEDAGEPMYLKSSAL